MWETTALVMHKIDPEKLEEIFPRLDNYIVNDIRETLSLINQSETYLLYHRVEYLRSLPMFRPIHEDVLSEIAKTMHILQLEKEHAINISEQSGQYALIINYSGAFDLKSGEEKLTTIRSGGIFFSKVFAEKENLLLNTIEETTLFVIDEQTLNLLLFDNIEFTNSLLRLVEEAV